MAWIKNIHESKRATQIQEAHGLEEAVQNKDAIKQTLAVPRPKSLPPTIGSPYKIEHQ